ncbi:hypothetical protein BBK36DRAFT_1182113 [Trichoderma citrinoviride]|uniref:Secreted protein n=1 Tax=Trichoderma citrinoviride TaxID=58853 RepID=A0A2T4B2G2_9HYPO|nr:hypothetical protein BBK36DRAFT_1182113 [Trichoderma citrinoviride]PTB63504.1 hypothetical protein BBK36DRAFT_1182113 [Trichoderma citrinoviride]
MKASGWSVWCLWRAAGQASNALTVPEAASSTRWHTAGDGLGRRSNVADRRQCDGQSMGAGGSRKLGEISGTALLRLQMQLQLRRHARMKTRPWACPSLSSPRSSIHASYGISPAPGRAGRGGDWVQGLADGVCSWQSKHPKHPRIPSSGGAAEGLRSPLGLAVEDERLPWSLEAPGGED